VSIAHVYQLVRSFDVMRDRGLAIHISAFY